MEDPNEKIIRIDYPRVWSGEFTIEDAPKREFTRREFAEMFQKRKADVVGTDDLLPDIPESTAFSPISWDAFNNQEYPEQRWRVRGLLPHEGFVILAAPSGEKKSWVAMEMARCIALGIPFATKFESEKGRVLYIEQESPKSVLQKRGRQLGISAAGDSIWLQSNDRLNLNTVDAVAGVIQFIKLNNISTVFIDTLRSVAGGLKENEADQVREFFDRYKPLKDLGVCVIFIDHCRKPAQFEGKIPKKEQVFASQDKIASVEVLLMIRSEKGNEGISVYQLKNRTSIELEPFMLLLRDEVDENGTTKTTLTYDSQIVESAPKKEEAKPLIEDILAEGGKTRKELLDIVRGRAEIGGKNISNAIKEMEDAGTIRSERRGRQKYYTLPPADNEETGPQEDEPGQFGI